MDIYSIVPPQAIVDISMWLNFFHPRNPGSFLIMNIKDGSYFIV